MVAQRIGLSTPETIDLTDVICVRSMIDLWIEKSIFYPANGAAERMSTWLKQPSSVNNAEDVPKFNSKQVLKAICLSAF